MAENLAVDPLDRTCTELYGPGTDSEHAVDGVEPQPKKGITVRELAQVPVFVLLGEPGMGKSEAMNALAAYTKAPYFTVDGFIVKAGAGVISDKRIYIDALDEARVSGDSTVWRELRTGLSKNQLTRFGVACRVADWQATDKDGLAACVGDETVRVFALDPLTAAQRRSLLKSMRVQDVAHFEEEAESLGFADMLDNPQSMKLLADAVKNRQGQWPRTRRDAYEMACLELLAEPNVHHQQAQRKVALLSQEALLEAAGWLCALMLLSNRSEVSEALPGSGIDGGVHLAEVLDAVPANSFSNEDVQLVLRRRLFRKPSGYASVYVPMHRTVAEYLAARHITQRIEQGGLLAGRVAALMLASPQHVVSNLRGLAGWLAALCEPMRMAIFAADPAAVLHYGDLHLLPPVAKQSLILQLATCPGWQPEGDMWWRQAPLHVPLVQKDMQGFVTDWLAQFQETKGPSRQASMTAGVLLNALASLPSDGAWEQPLLGLLRDERLADDVREAALDALAVHTSSPAVLLALLDDLHQGQLRDARGQLINYLLKYLYPQHLPPSKVLRFFKPTRVVPQGLPGLVSFWRYGIKRQTRDEDLPELMEALVQAVQEGRFSAKFEQISGHELEGLGSLVVEGLCKLGASAPTPRLASWLKLCNRSYEPASKPSIRLLSDRSMPRLSEWLREHPDKVQSVLAHWVSEDTSSWVAQRRLPFDSLPPGMGAFWLAQAQAFQKKQQIEKAKDCLETAVWWLQQADSSITLDDLAAEAPQGSALEEALTALLISPLNDNWQRNQWLSNRQHQEQAAVEEAAHENNRRYLLDNLDDVRTGKSLRYLHEAAWEELKHAGYGGAQDGLLIEQWRAAHPALDEATRQGHLALLYQLTAEQAALAVSGHKSHSIHTFELPSLLAAQHLYTQHPQQFFQLGKERLHALVTIFLLNHVSNSEWLLGLAGVHPEWVEEAWWLVCTPALRAKGKISIPGLGLLGREKQVRHLALRMLPRVLASWPAKFSALNFPEFVHLLEAVMRICPPAVVSEVVAGRLRKKSLGSLQTAYLVMAGLWVDPEAYSPKVDALLHKKQIVQSELLGFIGHFRRYGGPPEALPNWDIGTVGMLIRLFAPLCPAAYPRGSYRPDAKDAGRSFLYQLLGTLGRDTSDVAQQALQQLLADPALIEWRAPLEDARARQAQARAERAFALPSPRQVALTLQNKTPANPADLIAVGLDALEALQKEIRNSSTNRINRFWTVDANGKYPMPPRRPEPECRNVIADWFKGVLGQMAVSVDPEHQHGGQKQSDIVLRVQTAGQVEMLLPIEVKGDWNDKLWVAPYEQLAKQYASDPRCHGRGIYLVLWVGTRGGDTKVHRCKQHDNHVTHTAAELQQQLQQETDRMTAGMNMVIRAVVLDVSIDHLQMRGNSEPSV
jgi:hypothetical protein